MIDTYRLGFAGIGAIGLLVVVFLLGPFPDLFLLGSIAFLLSLAFFYVLLSAYDHEAELLTLHSKISSLRKDIQHLENEVSKVLEDLAEEAP